VGKCSKKLVGPGPVVHLMRIFLYPCLVFFVRSHFLDFSDLEWCEYDEKQSESVEVMELMSGFEVVKGKK
jgi:hypothetical protein